MARPTIVPTAGALAIKRKRYERSMHFIVFGELDLVTAHQLKQQCERVDPDEMETVLVDLAEVTSMDNAGLDLLFAAFAHFGERLVIIISPSCAHTIDISTARGVLPIIEG